MNLYLAFHPSSWAIPTYPTIPREWDLGLLVSYAYLDKYRPEYARNCPRLMLDSGAWSAWNSGTTINMPALVAESRRSCWNHVVSLDVIGDADASYRNAISMRQSVGPHVMPVFHMGEPFDLLARYCEQFEYVGLARTTSPSRPESMAWLGECFRREYPHRFHSFGWIYLPALREFPFYSADSSTWSMGPEGFGKWPTFGVLPVRKTGGRIVSLLNEVKMVAERQQYLRSRWRTEFARWSDSRSMNQTVGVA